MPEDPTPANDPDWDTSRYDPAPGYGGGVPDAGAQPSDPPPPDPGAAAGYPPQTPAYEPAPAYQPSPAPAPDPTPGAHPYHLTPAFDPEPDPPLTSAPTSFQLRFNVSADDAYDTNLSARLFIRWFVVVAIVIALAFIGIAWLRGTLDVWTIGASVLLVVGAVLLAPLTRWFVRRQYRSLEGQPSSATIDEWGLHYESPLGRQDVPWTGLTDVFEEGRVILFQYDTLPVAYLPRSAFVTVNQEEDALAFVRERIYPQPAGTGNPPR
jgi:hypothetical protein